MTGQEKVLRAVETSLALCLVDRMGDRCSDPTTHDSEQGERELRTGHTGEERLICTPARVRFTRTGQPAVIPPSACAKPGSRVREASLTVGAGQGEQTVSYMLRRPVPISITSPLSSHVAIPV